MPSVTARIAWVVELDRLTTHNANSGRINLLLFYCYSPQRLGVIGR